MGVALVTPFTESQEVDYKSLERLLEHLLRDGATDFIVIHGTTGESPCLTRQERQRVTDHVVEQVADGARGFRVALGEVVEAVEDPADRAGGEGVLVGGRGVGHHWYPPLSSMRRIIRPMNPSTKRLRW